MRYACLFSGIGAPLQAAYRVYGKENVEHIFSCEFDKFARQSFQAIYGIDDKHFHKDVREMDGKEYEGKVDVLVWGFPCTSYSIAGLRKGMEDEKTGDLFHQGLRILEQCKPKYTIIENVKGLLSIDGGKTMELIMRDLREAGYFCHYEVINSKDYGIPQNRERVFIVGFLDHEDYYRFQFAPKQPLTKRLKDVLEPIVDEKYYLSETAIKGFQTHAERMAERGNGFKFVPTDGDTVASSVTTKAGGRPDDNFVKVIGKVDCKGDDYIKRVYDDNGISPCLPTMQGGGQEPKIFDHQGRKRKWDNPELLDHCPTLRAQTHGNEPCVVEPKIIDLTNNFGEEMREYTEFAPCLRSERFGLAVQIGNISPSNHNGGVIVDSNSISTTILAGQGSGSIVKTVQDFRIRKLTPLECWRFQDFPDEAHEKAKAAGISDSQLYRQAGNSMTVAVLEMIFRQIEKAKEKDPQSLF